MAARKRVLSSQEEQRLRTILQSATLAALMDSRRWEPGDIVFQGGTSLHLAHGSARFSEDLDFMVRGGLSLEGLSRQVHKKLRLPPDVPADLRVAVTSGKDQRNPHMFYVTLGGAQVVGSVKVKIELWQTPAAELKSLRLKISTVTSPGGQAFVPTLILAEIFADKVYALGARRRVKPRDVFDLWWLCGKEKLQIARQDLQTRLHIYPAGSGEAVDTANAWLANAEFRLADLKATDAARTVSDDLQRWLPSSWPMDEATAAAMIAVAAGHLGTGIQMMRKLVAERHG